ncbi:CBS domain-containing protein [Bacillus pakistanensis]|uniref:CBS domain-containing protein n=1 Tax=Rossellomorea pakistanensis TaxID=992288 RepID=A0ABS2NFS9_9BACI|nr:CBS domain-containing protein [Bacillus pakistanensis]MBM7586702.1 CBS domain-containing protein [Bacillus pakistanensis]
MKVKEMMTKDVECCTLLDNVFEVAVKMKENNVGVIPIVNGERIVGMITDRDIVLRCVAEKHPNSSKVEDIMSNDLITIGPEETTDDALQLMARYQIRRIPVVEGDQTLLGVVSLGDFAIRHEYAHEAEEALQDISDPIYKNKPC